jgi:hypothetical protein
MAAGTDVVVAAIGPATGAAGIRRRRWQAALTRDHVPDCNFIDPEVPA